MERYCRLRISSRHRPDVRLCQPAGYRPRYSRHAPFLSASLSPGTRGPAAAGSRRSLCRDAAARALAALPPLIKGYLRLGGFVGDGAVVDEQFNTTDVCILVKTDLVTEKYSRHYERQSKDTWTA